MRPALVALFVLAAAPAHAGPKPKTTQARATVAEMQARPPSQRKHDKWWYERAASRCERRATEWARARCLRSLGE